MATAPAPAIQPDCQSTEHDYTNKVEALVIIAIVGMFLLHILGSLRRRSSSNLLHTIVMGVETLSYPLDFTLWAVFLVLLLGSTDSLTACGLNDIDNWKSIYVKHSFTGFLLLYIIWMLGGYVPGLDPPPLYGILLVVVLKGYVRIASMRMVSKSYRDKNVKVIVEYMKKDSGLEPFDPVTMEGYSYMVDGERYCVKRPRHTSCYKGAGLKVITVEQIWQCKGKLLLHGHGMVLKDLCLSMALSKMLNRRFAGFKLKEAELPKTHDFVFKGLLTGDKAYQRAFRVIEDELLFVHDFYYTRYFYLYQKGRYFILCLPVIMIALCLWLIIFTDNYFTESIFITVVVTFLEAYQLYLYIASGWFKVALVRSYDTTPFLQRNRSLEMIIGLLLRLKAFGPWKRRLGQYCILRELGRKSSGKKGRKQSVKLSENVKKAIVDSLLESNGHLTNGERSLQKNRVHDHLSWACDATATDGAVTRTIVVWHIATTLCEQQLDKQAREEETVKTASTLSKYCMHLLAFAPNLLPDHSSIAESILDESIDEARNLFEEAKGKNKKFTLAKWCEVLQQISTDDCVGDEARLVAQGVHLARQLTGNIQDSTTRWKVLSDFWVEMMLYVSPSDDARTHLEILARGGEFITHLWALLTHAGVLNRPTTVPKDVTV
ncbi:unnamed protein product [Urochloa decumbens]|uniref:DUF4220 domain-containing protein n=1 Tax=Urochloa decumbens TaxID=240449 RepID=A0ABC9APG6_9POAL